MNEIALNFATGDFSRKGKVVTEDEVGQLGETFN
ncbi:HAMP domain-containing protein [Salipaludibacillus daqingensis]